MAVKRTIALLMMLLLVLPAWQGSVHAQTVSEYQIKAAFLYNFAKFIDWPPDAPQGVSNDFKIGILGNDPFGSEINVIEDKLIRGKPLKILRAATLKELCGCEVIFISASVKPQLGQILRSLQTKPVLTVGDTSGFAQQGVMINLITVGNKIRFQINLEATDRAGLKVSSHLLRLADIVKEND
jgi:hypothetical protein